MQYFKRITSFILILFFIIVLLDLNINIYSQEDAYNINLRVKKPSDTQGLLITESSLVLQWNPVPEAQYYIIKYWHPEDTNNPNNSLNYKEITSQSSDGTEKEIRGLKANFIYNFEIEAWKNDHNQIDLNFENNNVRVLTKLNFIASRPHLEINPDINIDEIGNEPELLMELNIPRQWDNDVEEIKTLYGQNYNYRIDIGNNKEATNLGAFYIEYDINESTYKFIKDEYDDETKTTIKKDITSESEFTVEDNKFKFILNEDSLPQISPGTIYYATVIPQFVKADDGKKYTDERFKYGLNSVADKKQNKPYTYTHLYVKLSTGNNETILIEVDQVNKQVSEQGNVGDFNYIVKSAKTSNVEDYGIIEGSTDGKYVDKEDPIAFIIVKKEFQTTYYYWVKAQSAQEDIILDSPTIVYNISRGKERSPLPENVTVSQVTTVEASEGNEDTANITIRWKKPERYDNIKSQLNYEIELNVTEQDSQENHSKKYRKVYEFNALEMESTDKYNIVGDYIELTILGHEIKDMEPPDGLPHPNYDPLKLNEIYFLRMRSFINDIGTASDYSIPISFTSGIIQDIELPIPIGLTTYTQGVDKDCITLSWQVLDIDWHKYHHSPDNIEKKVYYELSVSTDSEREDYILNSGEERYGNFKTVIQAAYGNENESFPLYEDSNIAFAKLASQNLITAEVTNLLPDKTYYFIIRTILEIGDKTYYSYYSNIHAEQTMRGDEEFPPDDERKLVTPDPDTFKVSEDAEGNLLITSYTVQVEWEKANKDDYYSLIWTQNPVQANETIEQIELNNIIYGQVMGLKDDSKSLYTYNIGDKEHDEEQLSANTQYYVSIRAERDINLDDDYTEPQRKSAWLTMPITTKIIEPPKEFEILYDDSNYFDTHHWIKLKWKALDSEAYKFDIAIRPEDNTLQEHGYDIYSSDSPYIILEKLYKDNQSKPSGLDKNYNYFICTIKKLQANTKYYTKVRVKDTDSGAVSKYTNTLSTRTEFDQEEYDEKEQDERNDIVFNDKIKKFIDSYLWVYRNDSSFYNVKVRGSKAINFIDNNKDNYFYIDITQANNKRAYRKTVYIPYKVIEHLEKLNKNLVIRTENGDIHYRPGFLNERSVDIKYLIERQKDYRYFDEIFVQLNFENIRSTNRYEPSGMQLKSNITELTCQVEGFTITDDEIEYNINNMLYGKDGKSGLIAETRDDFLYLSYRYKDNPKELENQIQRLFDEIEYELGKYISYEYLDSRYFKEITRKVTTTELPMLLNLNYDIQDSYNQGYTSAYINLTSGSRWDEVESNLADGICSVNTKKFGTYAVLSTITTIYDTNQDGYTDDIRIIDGKYNITSLLSVYGYFELDKELTTKDAIIILERIIKERSNNMQDLDYITRANELGIGEKLNLRQLDKSIQRQEMAYLAMRLYEIKSGASIQYMKSPSNVSFADEHTIREDLYKYVSFCRAYDFMEVEDNRFNPNGSISRGQAIVIIKKVLEKLGEI